MWQIILSVLILYNLLPQKCYSFHFYGISRRQTIETFLFSKEISIQWKLWISFDITCLCFLHHWQAPKKWCYIQIKIFFFYGASILIYTLIIYLTNFLLFCRWLSYFTLVVLQICFFNDSTHMCKQHQNSYLWESCSRIVKSGVFIWITVMLCRIFLWYGFGVAHLDKVWISNYHKYLDMCCMLWMLTQTGLLLGLCFKDEYFNVWQIHSDRGLRYSI